MRRKFPPLTCKAWHLLFQSMDTHWNFPRALHHIMSDFFSSQGPAPKNHLHAAVSPPIHTKGHWLKYHLQGFEGYRMGRRVPWGQDVEGGAPCWEYSAGILDVGDPKWSRNNTPRDCGPWSIQTERSRKHVRRKEKRQKRTRNHHKPTQPSTKMRWGGLVGVRYWTEAEPGEGGGKRLPSVFNYLSLLCFPTPESVNEGLC